MAFEQTLRTVGLPAAADLTSGGTVNPQFYLVTVNSSGQINFTGAGAVADGVVQDKPNAQGVEGEVAILGITKLVTGAAVNNGDPLMANASGQAITATSRQFRAGARAGGIGRRWRDHPRAASRPVQDVAVHQIRRNHKCLSQHYKTFTSTDR